MKPAARNFSDKLSFVGGLALLLLSGVMVSCERDATVSIDGNAPPTFRMSGSGDLVFFAVSEIAKENQNLAPAQRDSRKDTMMWQIWPDNRPSTDKKIDRLPSITYGVVPPGFVQKKPENGDAPALLEGRVYEAGGPATNANGGFTIRDGRSVQIPETNPQ